MCIHVSVLLCAHWAGWEEGVGWDEGLKNFNHVFHQQHWAQTYCCAGASVTKRSWRRLPANPLCPPGRAEMKIIHLTSGEQTFHFNSVFILYALKKKKNSFEPGEDASCDTEFLIFLKVFYFELPRSVWKTMSWEAQCISKGICFHASWCSKGVCCSWRIYRCEIKIWSFINWALHNFRLLLSSRDESTQPVEQLCSQCFGE